MARAPRALLDCRPVRSALKAPSRGDKGCALAVNVLACERWIEAYLPFLRDAIESPVDLGIVPSTKDDDVCPLLADADIAITQYFTPAMGRSAKRLRLVLAPGAGYDKIDRKALPHGVVVANTYEHERAVAEYTLMQCLALSRELLQADATLRRNDWSMWNPLGHPFYPELGGKTIGIVGLGRIGREVARLAAAFDLRRIGVDLFPPPPDQIASLGLEFVGSTRDLDRVLRESDFVVLAVPLNDATRHLIGARELGLMKRTAYIINPARGPVVEERALYEALRNHTIKGAAIDAWYRYPATLTDPLSPSIYPFDELTNVVMTPHIAGGTSSTIERRLRVTARNVDRFVRGEPLVNVIAELSGAGPALASV